jgi:hypothetical protein
VDEIFSDAGSAILCLAFEQEMFHVIFTVLGADQLEAVAVAPGTDLANQAVSVFHKNTSHDREYRPHLGRTSADAGMADAKAEPTCLGARSAITY